MMTFNHEITIRRNETFTIDKIIQNRDESPYIISDRLSNPHFVVTVTNSLYDQENRYVCNMWLPINLPRFELTVPVNIKDFTSMDGSQLYNSFEDMGGLPSGYINGTNIQFEEDDALFYVEDYEGNKTYKYWKNGKWNDYECRIVCKFLQNITREWIERNYYYNIDLVAGPLNPDATSGERPFARIDEMIPILGSTKLSVLSNLKGGM